MRFRLRTLLIVLALGPPWLAFVSVLASSAPSVVTNVFVLWSVLFFASLAWWSGSRTELARAVTECLIVVAITGIAFLLLTPDDPRWYSGYRE
jgi:hypothetical protein